jgi:hypothetical protein
MNEGHRSFCERKSFLLLGYLEYRSTSRSLNSSQQKQASARRSQYRHKAEILGAGTEERNNDV